MCDFWGQIFFWFYCSVSLSSFWHFWHLLAVSLCSYWGSLKVSVPNLGFSYASTNAHYFKKKSSTVAKNIHLFLKKVGFYSMKVQFEKSKFGDMNGVSKHRKVFWNLFSSKVKLKVEIVVISCKKRDLKTSWAQPFLGLALKNQYTGLVLHFNLNIWIW